MEVDFTLLGFTVKFFLLIGVCYVYVNTVYSFSIVLIFTSPPLYICMINLTAVLIILAVFSIFFGYITKDIFIGLGSGFFADNSIFIHPSHEILLDTEYAVPTLFKLLPFLLTLTLSGLAILLSEIFPKILINFKFSRFGYNVFGFFNQRFLIEMFYNKYITNTVLKLGGQTTKFIDKGSVELMGPYGLEKSLLSLSKSISNLDTGVITTYALYILIGLISYIVVPYISFLDSSLILVILYGLLNINDIKQYPVQSIP